MSSAIASMPGLVVTTAAKCPLRRPEMITLFPRLCSASARARPIPDPPPVMRIVFPVRFIVAPICVMVDVAWKSNALRGEAVAKHRKAADGLYLGHLVLQNVPMLLKKTVFEADNVGDDPGDGPSVTG